MGKKIKIQVYCNTGYAGCSHNDIIEIPLDEWQSMTEKEQNDFLNEAAFENMTNHIEYGAYVAED